MKSSCKHPIIKQNSWSLQQFTVLSKDTLTIPPCTHEPSLNFTYKSHLILIVYPRLLTAAHASQVYIHWFLMYFLKNYLTWIRFVFSHVDLLLRLVQLTVAEVHLLVLVRCQCYCTLVRRVFSHQKPECGGSCHLWACSTPFLANLHPCTEVKFQNKRAHVVQSCIVVSVCACLCASAGFCSCTAVPVWQKLRVRRLPCGLRNPLWRVREGRQKCFESDRWKPGMGTIPHDIRRLLDGNDFLYFFL